MAHADTAETKGGLTIKSQDGRFEMRVGGRIHFDGYAIVNDDGAPFGSGLTGAATALPAQGGFEFRRTYLTLSGTAYGWLYKFEHDFASQGVTGQSGYRDMWIATDIGPGQVKLGQFKPFRGMEELTSSNEITMTERPWTSATGIYSGRQYLVGVGYQAGLAERINAALHLMQLGIGQNSAGGRNEGHSLGLRVAFFPYSAEGSALHVGLSYSLDREQAAAGASLPSVGAIVAAPYGGRRGAVLNLGAVGIADTTRDYAQETLGLELAGSFGPVALQSEYAIVDLEATHLDGSNTAGSDVSVYYLQAGVFLTGERVPYRKDRATFGKPKPLGAYGAFELTARYEVAQNHDEDAVVDICTVTTGVAPVAAPTQCEVSTIITGLNWYANPNVRLMLNYSMGRADLGVAGQDEPEALTLRTQFAF